MIKLIAALFVLILPVTVNAQEVWSRFQPRWQVTDLVRLVSDNQVRFVPGFNDVKNAFTELQTELTFARWLETQTAIRYRFAGDNYYRLSQDITLIAFSESKLYPSFRTRYQQELNSGGKTILRARAELTYKHSGDLKPYTSFEIFYRLNDVNQVRDLRYTIGINTDLTRSLLLRLYYRIDTEVNVDRPDTDNILGVGLLLNIHKLKNKKSDQ